MKTRLLTTVLAVLVAFCGANFTVLTAASHEDHHGDHTLLGEQMETISKAFRSLRRQAKDASKNAESAALAGKMHKAAMEAIKHDPAWTEDQPAGEQAAFVKGFKKQMETFIAALADLEKAFKSGDNAKAEVIIGELRDLQKEGHKAYKAPEEE